ncbi:MAG: hypothetical protein JW832_18110 [Deltaproteobacteria bacterium]|nr:hypothetical protein [Deltaproteobacteria bacterium]
MDEINEAVAWIKEKQNADGGWGAESSAGGTAWHLIALNEVGCSGIEIARGVEWLLRMQHADGGWAAYPGMPESNTYNTALATWALAVSSYHLDIDLELLFSKPYYYPGDKVTMAVNVLNTDTDNMSVNGNVKEYGGANVSVEFTKNSNAGKSFVGSYIVRSDQAPGTDTVSATALKFDMLGVTAGSFIVKNGAGVKPDPAILPENITLEPLAPYAGDNVTVKARVTNAAMRDAVNVRVYCYDGHPDAGGTLIDNITIERVCGLEGVDVAFAWQAVGGGHEIYIVLYPDQAIGDLNAGNNQAYATIDIEETSAGADLVIYSYDVTIDPTVPVEGQPVTISAIVRNIGGSASAASTVFFSESAGGFHAVEAVPALAPGDTATVAANWPSLGKTGRNYIHCIVNPEGTIPEARYDNNETVKSIDVAEPSLPNLSIRSQDIFFSPLIPLAAEPVEISATVVNWGTPAGGFSVRFYDGEPAGNNVIGESYVYETLYFGQSTTVSAVWDAPRKTAGEHYVYGAIDPDGEITEFSETDNIAGKSLIVGSGNLSVMVEPDRQVYAAFDNATLRLTIASLDGSSHTAALDVVIKDGSGAVAGSPTSGKQVAVDGAAPAVETIVWNTGELPSGSYTAWAVVHEGDTVQAAGSAGFAITADRGLAAEVATDRAQYYGHEKIALTASVRSFSSNYTFTGLHARLRIVNAAGDELHADNGSIAVLPPLQTAAFTVQWSPAAAPPGIYTALLDVSGGAAVLFDNATFTILPSQAGGKALQGAVSIAPEQVHAGDTATLAWRITNTGNTALPDVTLTLSVMDAAAQQVVDNASDTCSIGIGASCNGVKIIDTANLPPGDYAIILSAASGGVSQTLAFARFSLVNQCPAADAGADTSAYIGASVTLDGSRSSDPDNDSLSYRWVLAENPQDSMAQLRGETTAACSFTPDRHGEYVFDLVVNDGFCDSPADRVIITIVNRSPLADAGPDQEGHHISDTITLGAGGSSDPDGDAIAGWEWSLIKPDGSSAELTSSDAASTAFVADMKGQYRISLKVYDGIGWSTADEVVATVVNRCPVAEAGSDRLALVGETAQVDGSGSYDPDGDAIAYHWELVAWPLRSMSQPIATTERECSITPDRRGEYVLELVVNDGACESPADRVIVSTENRPPIAEAGGAQLGHVGNTITLDAGLSSDPDNDTLLSWQWEFVEPLPAGSAAMLTSGDTVTTAFILDKQGDYRVSLKVFDGLAWSEPDEVVVSTENRCPEAVAGDNQTAHTGRAVRLDGRGSSDPDNDTITFRWALNAPEGSMAGFDNASSATPVFAPDMIGKYVAVLIVHDGICDSPAARVTVTVVNECPVADAGDNQSAQADQTVYLDGSGSFDPDNDSLSYSWSLTAPQGSAAVLDTATGAQPSFAADMAGEYRLILVVHDGSCESPSDTVSITVAGSSPATGCIEAPLPEPPCAMKADYGPGGTTGDAVKIYSYADYEQYEASNYGYANGKYKKLKIMSGISMPSGDLVMHSPAEIEIGKYVHLAADSGVICLDGRMGVSGDRNHFDADEIALLSEQGDVFLGKWSQVSCGMLYIIAGGSARIGDSAQVAAAGPVAVLSTGVSPAPGAEVGQGAEVMADTLIMHCAGPVLVSEYAHLAIAGAVQLSSTADKPGSSVRVKPGAAVAAASLCMTGPEEVSVGPGSAIAAHDFFIASTGDGPSGKAAIKPGTMITVYGMSLTGFKAWLEPLSHLMIHGNFHMEASDPDGCSMKGFYWSQTESGNCLE